METVFTEAELNAWKKEYASNATQEQFDLWIETCKRRNLIPVEDMVLQIRATREYDEEAKTKIFKKKAVYITTIRALLRLAERTGKYRGFTPAEWIYLDDNGDPTIASVVPLADKASTERPRLPWAVRVGVRRNGFDDPQITVCRFWAYAQTFEVDGKKKLNSTWTTRGPEQLAKCAKAAALRENFPEELGGLYLSEEFQNEDEAPKKETAAAPVVEPPAPPTAPPVNQVPAEGKDNPRPGEEKKPIVDKAEIDAHYQEQVDRIKNAGKQEPGAATPATVVAPTPEAPKEKKTRTRKAPVKKDEPKSEPPAEDSRPEITDADLPENLQPGSEEGGVEIEDTPPPPETPKDDGNRPITKEEGIKFSEQMKVFAAKVGSKDLLAYVLKFCKVEATKQITFAQWTKVLKTLNGAVDDNDLKQIVKG